MVPARLQTKTDAPIVWRPGCSKTMSGSSPTRARMSLPRRRHSRLVLGVLVAPEPVARRLAVDDGLDAEVVEQGDLVR